MKQNEYDIEYMNTLLIEYSNKFYDKKRLIHPNTIKNFLYHFHAFKDRKKKEHIYINLKLFFDELSNLESSELTPSKSSDLFNQFILPIMNYYDAYQNFSVHFKGIFFIIIGFLVISVGFLTNISLVYIIVAVLSISLIYFYNRFKESKNKTYGTYY